MLNLLRFPTRAFTSAAISFTIAKPHARVPPPPTEDGQGMDYLRTMWSTTRSGVGWGEALPPNPSQELIERKTKLDGNERLFNLERWHQSADTVVGRWKAEEGNAFGAPTNSYSWGVWFRDKKALPLGAYRFHTGSGKLLCYRFDVLDSVTLRRPPKQKSKEPMQPPVLEYRDLELDAFVFPMPAPRRRTAREREDVPKSISSGAGSALPFRVVWDDLDALEQVELDDSATNAIQQAKAIFDDEESIRELMKKVDDAIEHAVQSVALSKPSPDAPPSLFSTLPVSGKMATAINEAGWTEMTDVQSRSSPLAMRGLDVMASAQTGSGKTAAFTLPVLDRLLKVQPLSGQFGPRALILTPTRELADQIIGVVHHLSKFTSLKSACFYGGVSYQNQLRFLRRSLDLIVATPGRLIDLLDRRELTLDSIDMFVIDEADRMLDMGFIPDVKRLVSEMPPHHQTLLYSATLDGPVEQIARAIMQNPLRVRTCELRDLPASIDQRILPSDDTDQKLAQARRLMCGVAKRNQQALIFTSTKSMADNVARVLSQAPASGKTLLDSDSDDDDLYYDDDDEEEEEETLDVDDDGRQLYVQALHGDLTQSSRREALDHLSEGLVDAIAATDVAARGLDIRNVAMVINFDVPFVPEQYVHRVGRTGRMGAQGQAITLVSPQDWGHVKAIESLLGKTIPDLPPLNGLVSRRSRRPLATRSLRGFEERPRKSNDRWSSRRPKTIGRVRERPRTVRRK